MTTIKNKLKIDFKNLRNTNLSITGTKSDLFATKIKILHSYNNSQSPETTTTHYTLYVHPDVLYEIKNSLYLLYC